MMEHFWSAFSSMSLLEVIAQVLIPVMSMASVGCAQLEVLQRWKARKYAPVIGLMVQPFWFYSAGLHGQFGTVIASLFFTALYAYAFYEQWVKPRRVALVAATE